jgi:hypothetical protein
LGNARARRIHILPPQHHENIEEIKKLKKELFFCSFIRHPTGARWGRGQVVEDKTAPPIFDIASHEIPVRESGAAHPIIQR